MTTRTDPPAGWRMLDIVVAAVLAVAFGAVFLAWNNLNNLATPLFTALPAAQAGLYGVWLLPGVLVGLIVRRPGAALFGGLVSAAVSVVLGSQYGADALLSGLIQGGGAELGFAVLLYRAWNLPAAMLAGALAGVAAAVHDVVVYYALLGAGYWVVYIVAAAASGVVIAGIGSWLLVRALAATGVLSGFAAGRDQRRI
ncbi:MAG: ECF transporter S component [Chloroflexota bacterium]